MTRTSKRSDWHAHAALLNSKCNPSTPLSLELPHSQHMIDASWSSRASLGVNQPAGADALHDHLLHICVVADVCYRILNFALCSVQCPDRRPPPPRNRRNHSMADIRGSSRIYIFGELVRLPNTFQGSARHSITFKQHH